MLTAERLRELLVYNRTAGVFRWRVRRSPKAVIGSIAGTIHKNGDYQCIQIKIDGRHYKAHRLAWLHETGSWPAIDVDHRNGVAIDNRWLNLREATKSGNQQNRSRAARNSKTGIKGVSPVNKAAGYARPMFAVHIQCNGRRRYLGAFPTVEEAERIHRAAELEMFGEWARPCKVERKADDTRGRK